MDKDTEFGQKAVMNVEVINHIISYMWKHADDRELLNNICGVLITHTLEQGLGYEEE